MKHRSKIILYVQLDDMGLLGSNYRQVQDKIKTKKGGGRGRRTTDSSFDNSSGTAT